MAEDTGEQVQEDEAAENDGAAEDTEEEKKPEDEEDVPVRNVVNAQRRIIEKQSKQLKKSSEEEKDDTELTPQARKLIEEEVERRISPLKDELSFRDYFAEHPEDRKYEKAAKKRYEAWPNTPIQEVMKTLRPAKAEDKAAAEDKATRGSMKGGSARPQEGHVATTQKEMEEVYKNVKRGETGAALKKLGIK